MPYIQGKSDTYKKLYMHKYAEEMAYCPLAFSKVLPLCDSAYMLPPEDRSSY